MKTDLPCRSTPRSSQRRIGFAAALLLAALPGLAAPFGSAFTYQGRLNSGGSPAIDGLYDFSFTLHGDATTAAPVGTPSTLTVGAMPVTNGLFTVQLDFGASVFTNGEARWLQLQVNTNGLTPLVSLIPRQRLTPAPQAIYAGSAATAVTATTVAPGAVTSSGLAPGSVNGAAIADGSITSTDLSPSLLNTTFWKLGGNVATDPSVNFLGTADSQPLVVVVGGARALRLEPHGANSPGMIGGFLQNNSGGFIGATIAGGGTSGSPNAILGSYGFVGAGHGGQAGDYDAVVGGAYNSALGQFSFVGTGLMNTNRGLYAGLVAGTNNFVSSTAESAFIGGGADNRALGAFSTVSGGLSNLAAGFTSFAAGNRAKANHNGSFVWADSQTSDFVSLTRNQFLIRAAGFVGINKNDPATALDVNGTVTATGFSGSGAALANVNADTLGGLNGSSFWKSTGNAGTTPGTQFLGTTDNQALELKVNGIRGFLLQPGTTSPNVVGGGFASVAAGLNAVTIGGGQENNVSSSSSTIGGGLRNSIGSGAQDSAIGGGQLNGIANNAAAATVAGGTLNAIGAGSEYAAIGGGRFNRISDGGAQSTIGGGRNNLVDVNSMGATIAGGTNNLIGSSSAFASVGGGADNQATGSYSTVGGGYRNTSSGIFATVGGGVVNTSSEEAATVGGGTQNTSSGPRATVGGGEINTSSRQYATVGGGFGNTSSGSYATVGGGYENTSSGKWAAVPGGANNTAGGDYSFAAGQSAKANHRGSFVWADSQFSDFASTADNQFLIRGAGGVGINTANPATSLEIQGATPDGPSLRLTGIGGLGARVGMDLATYDPRVYHVANVPARIEASDNSWSASIDFQTKTPGVSDSALTSRLFIQNDGRVGIGTTSPGTALHVIGNILATGTVCANNVNCASDRNVKAGFESVDSQAILAKVAALSITRWHYTNDPATPHLGAVAQDFHAAFAVGTDDKHIATVDADGVALAAIQGLNQKVEEKNARIVELERRLEKLEHLMIDMSGGAK